MSDWVSLRQRLCDYDEGDPDTAKGVWWKEAMACASQLCKSISSDEVSLVVDYIINATKGSEPHTCTSLNPQLDSVDMRTAKNIVYRWHDGELPLKFYGKPKYSLRSDAYMLGVHAEIQSEWERMLWQVLRPERFEVVDLRSVRMNSDLLEGLFTRLRQSERVRFLDLSDGSFYHLEESPRQMYFGMSSNHAPLRHVMANNEPWMHRLDGMGLPFCQYEPLSFRFAHLPNIKYLVLSPVNTDIDPLSLANDMTRAFPNLEFLKIGRITSGHSSSLNYSRAGWLQYFLSAFDLPSLKELDLDDAVKVPLGTHRLQNNPSEEKGIDE